MTEPVVLLERPAEGVALVRINRPDARNALNMDVRRLIAKYMLELSEDDSVRCVVLTGNDKAFAAGADLKEMATLDSIAAMQRKTDKLWRDMASCTKPVIAAVSGLALGGGSEMAMACDIIIAAESTKFGQPEVKVGVMPGGGGTQRLIRAVGKYKAMKICLTGELFSAREAFDMGLVSEVVPDGEAEKRAVAMAAHIATMPPIAIQQTKEVINAGQDVNLDTALRLETKAIQLLFSSQDQKEGAKAFMEKRAPKFAGK
jgi:enoyl-CoA hydratase/carnithine racemase